MNLIEFGVEEVARRIKLRMVARKGSWEVYVAPSGEIRMLRIGDERTKLSPPQAHLMGVYTSRAKVEELEEDLADRLEEIEAEAEA